MDLRAWLDRVDQLGQLEKIDGVDWDLELSVLAELLNEKFAQQGHPRPALLFDRIAGYPEGRRVAANLVSSSGRLALTLGMDPHLGEFEFIQQWRRQVKKVRPIEPEFIRNGTLFENRMSGSGIDLLTFPVPRWHERDGGRYIGTDDLVITRDPDDGWVNVGVYRVMVYDREHVGLHMSPGKHGRVHRDKHFQAGKPCPVAISFGHHPIYFLVGSSDTPYGVSEYAYAGGILDKPVQLVRGPLTGLPLPADSEIAIEGEVVPGETRVEGPFGEWTGYYTSSQNEPVLRVRAVYHRSDPILCGFPLLRPSSGDNLHHCLIRAAHIWNALDDAGVPEIKAVWVHPAAGRFLTVLSIRQRYPGHAKQAATIASQCRAGAYLGRYVIVVDDDIDVTKSDDVIWALCSRSDPVRSIDILRRCWSGPLDPAIHRDEKGFNSRAIIDATRPYEWRDKFPVVSGHSPELKAQVRQKWADLIDKRIRRNGS
ncbi:MAG TPA: UbiD family decarboxylase [Candidatus Eisenbacteria bacterium]|nr:UbiD family decarboxylase [Candidatus Eisenbacteria bacterium]